MNCAGLSNNCFDKSGIIKIFVSLHDKYALFFSVDHDQLAMCARSKINRRIFFPFPETISVKQFAVMRDGHCTEFGTYEELMNLKGEFYQLKKLQS